MVMYSLSYSAGNHLEKLDHWPYREGKDGSPKQSKHPEISGQVLGHDPVAREGKQH
jgi:hypothetical protein